MERWVNVTMSEEENRVFFVMEPATFAVLNVSFGLYADDLLRLGPVTFFVATLEKTDAWGQALEDNPTNDTELHHNKNKKN